MTTSRRDFLRKAVGGSGVAAFELISPIGILHRGWIFGLGAGWIAVAAALLLFDLGLRGGWCGHLCPLGAFYSLTGPLARIRMGFDADSCTRCGDCIPVCPEPKVLDFDRATKDGFFISGNCTNCGRCIPACPEESLAFAWRSRAARDASRSTETTRRAA